jgi:hypothetical protein
VNRDPIEDNTRSRNAQRRTQSIWRTLDLNLYAFLSNRTFDRFDLLGLETSEPGVADVTTDTSGITEAAGLAAFEGARSKLKDMCAEPCCKCRRWGAGHPREGEPIARSWDPCSPDDCKKEADNIIDSIKRTWDYNFSRGSNDLEHNVGGYLCWDWSHVFMQAMQRMFLKCWSSHEIAFDNVWSGFVFSPPFSFNGGSATERRPLNLPPEARTRPTPRAQ